MPESLVARRSSVALAVFLFLSGIYLLTTGGHFYASDEEALFGATASLVEHGSFALNAGTPDPPVYTPYGPGQSIAAIPLYLLGKALATAFPPAGSAYIVRAAVGWLNPLVTAGVAALIAVAGMRLGYGPRTSAAAALIYGLATMAWPQSKTFFSEPLAGGLTFAAFVVLLGDRGQGTGDRGQGTGDRGQGTGGRYALAGLLAGLACTVKIQAGLALPLIGLYVLYLAYQSARATRRSSSFIIHPSYFAVGAALGLGLLGLYQWAQFGNPLRSSYGSVGGVGGVLSGDWPEGIYGLLLSPGKGIVWYAPPLILLPLGLTWLYRRDRAAVLLCGSIGLATLLFYAKVTFWHGDGAWGPRYLHMALPFMALPLLAVVDAASSGRRAIRLALAATLLLALPVQLAGVAISLNAYLGVQRNAQARYFVPSQSPIIGHLRLASAQLAVAYDLALAPDSIVLRDGFSYSEGDRAAGEQLPRWTLPVASIDLRPPATGDLRVDLALSGCRPAPVSPATLALRLDGRSLGDLAACPPRRVSLLLPPQPTQVTIISPGWDPAAAGIDREGPLGIFVTAVAARADAQPLTLRGNPVPTPPLPAGPTALRLWASDYRYGHWDLWPWYLAHSGLPAAPSVILGVLWAGAGLGLAIAGVWLGIVSGRAKSSLNRP